MGPTGRGRQPGAGRRARLRDALGGQSGGENLEEEEIRNEEVLPLVEGLRCACRGWPGQVGERHGFIEMLGDP